MVFPRKQVGTMRQLDRTDVVVLVGALVLTLGLYMQFGAAWAVMFVGVVLIVTGLLSSWRLSLLRRQAAQKKREG